MDQGKIKTFHQYPRDYPMSPTPLPTPPGWQPAALNRGWTYRNRVDNAGEGQRVCDFYAERYPHSGHQTWLRRLADGESRRQDLPIQADAPLARGDLLAWQRPPWQEAAVPGSWQTISDDGDLLALDKPSGLPVMPAGGFLEHTLLPGLGFNTEQPFELPTVMHRNSGGLHIWQYPNQFSKYLLKIASLPIASYIEV